MPLQVGVKTTYPFDDHDHSGVGEGGALVDAAFAVGVLSGTKITDATLGDAKISDVDGSKLVTASVPETKISGTIDGAKITDTTLVEGKISGTINGSKIADASLPDGKISGMAAGDKVLALPAADVTTVEAMTTPKVHIEDEG